MNEKEHKFGFSLIDAIGNLAVARMLSETKQRILKESIPMKEGETNIARIRRR